jgi:hypothetical protein
MMQNQKPQAMIAHPNKTFVLDIDKMSSFGDLRKHFVIVVADTKETAAMYLKDKLGFDGVPNDLTWLMGCNHPTIYNQTGNKPLEIQAKIMYNTSVIIGG